MCEFNLVSRISDEMAFFGEFWGYTSLLLLAALARLLLVYYARIQDYICEVKFTDIDYRVYTDAAKLIADGHSPFERPTYRYTPVLAWILQPTIVYPEFGKMLFVCADLWVGWLIYEMVKRRAYRVIQDEEIVEKIGLRSMCMWLFNPLTAIVSTRGNADVLVCAAVLTTLYLLLNTQHRYSWMFAAIVHGALAVHLKIYPIIYLPSVFIYLLPDHVKLEERGPTAISWWFNLIKSSLCNVRGIVYCVVTLFVSALSFYLCYLWCGQKFVDESLLYHVTRVDRRHNFSPYFYAFYVASRDLQWTRIVSLVAFVPQALLTAYFAIRYTRQNLPFAWLVTTMSFVAFNKVCTSQYFIWWLCLLPIIQADLSTTFYCGLRECDMPVFKMAVLWALSQGLWLSLAYLLEFQGINTFVFIWIASLILLGVHCYMIRTLCSCFERMKQVFHIKTE